MTTKINSVVHEGSYRFWLGGSDMGHEGDWKWINSGEPVPDFVWNTGSNSYFEMIYLLSYGIFQESQAVE